MDHDLIQSAQQHLDAIHDSSHPPHRCVWIVALSGGCDSRVLLDVCCHHARHHHITLITAHINHQLRSSAARDAEFCESLTKKNPLIAQHHHIKVHVTPTRGSTQDGARRARWEQLALLAHTHQACAILTGHHLDDALETMLMHAARGSGSRGLASLYTARAALPFPDHAFAEQVIVHRPLISCTRAEIEAHARARNLEWVEDPTNATDAYTRNRIRHHAMPHLVAEQGGHVGWRRTLDILNQEADFITSRVDALWTASVSEHVPWEGALSIERGALMGVHPLLLTRLFLRAHARLAASHHAPGQGHIEAFLALCTDTASDSGHVATSGMRVECEAQVIVMMSAPERGARGWFDHAQEPVLIDVKGRSSGEVMWAGSVMRWTMEELPPDPRDALWCRVDVTDGVCMVLRGVRPGERLEGRRTKEVLRELGVPVWRRHLWPCLGDGHSLIAIAGWRTGGGTHEPETGSTTRWLILRPPRGAVQK